MLGRFRLIGLLLIIAAFAYVFYSKSKKRRGTSRGDFHRDVFAAHITRFADPPPMDQGRTVAVSSDGGPVDVRSDGCRQQRYATSDTRRLTASLVVDLPGDGVDLKRFYSNVDSLLSGSEQTENGLVDEVIVVAAAGLDGPAAAEVDRYVTSLAVVSRFVRNAGTGQVSARTAGAKLALSPVVVFADWRAVGTVGWLRPLLATLAVEPESIVVPHFVDASDPTLLVTTSEHLLAEYMWPLSVRMMANASALPTSHGLYRSSALRGDVFAVRRQFWDELGGYDEALGDDSAGASVELSIRAWQCGSDAGAIVTNRCSHVGVGDLGRVVRVVEPSSVRHIARLWFGDRRAIVMRTVGVSPDPRHADADARPAGKRDDCRNIDTYFNDVAVLPVPSTDAVHFGQLRADTGKLHGISRYHNSSCTNGRIKPKRSTQPPTLNGKGN